MSTATMDRPTDRPAYTADEAARYAMAAPTTVRRWLKGYSYETVTGPRQARAVGEHRPADRFLTFNDLVEVAAIASAIREGVTLPRVRSAIEYARDLFNAARPLLLERFLTDGRSLYLRELDVREETARHLNASEAGQIAFPYIAEVLRHLEYDEHGAPYRWWPRGKEGGVLVDPKISFGHPVLFPSAIRTETIVDRFMAGESAAEICAEFDLTVSEVEEAIRFENRAALIAA